MKRVLLVLMLLIGLASQATVYYISATGSDSANGLTEGTAWQTLTKVNAQTFVAGDQVLFKKGNGWYGVLNINQSGTNGNVIKFSTYGTGATPTITGFTTITGWTNEGGGIYSKVITSDSQTNKVTIDGVDTPMGRYPNSTYLTYESFSTDVSITDTSLPASPNWTGAELIKRPNDWDLERCLITNHSGNTITYTNALSNYTGVAGNGYFIQNDLRTLDAYGEWYHDTSTGKFYMYFGAVDPTTKTVKVATKNYCIDVQGETYITIDGLQLNGAIKNCVYTSSASANLTIKNCTISFAGTNGVYVNGTGSLIDNNTISYCNSSAVRGGSNSITVANNTISNNGLIKGASEAYYNAVMLSATNGHTIQYNSIVNSGSDGVMVNGTSNTISNNFINYSNLILNDGGGIYTAGTNTGTVIDGNIVLNSYGNTDGGNTTISISEGIYLDESANGITVQNNTVAYCGFSGIKLHKAHDNTISNNTCYGNNITGIYILNSSASVDMANNTITGNFLIAKAGQYAFYIKDVKNAVPLFGTSNNNVFARPIDDDDVVAYYPTGGFSTKTRSQWNAATSQDSNTTSSPKAITSAADMSFQYNASKTASTVYFDWTGVNPAGTVVLTSKSLSAYASIVSIKSVLNPTGNKKAAVSAGKPLKDYLGRPLITN